MFERIQRLENWPRWALTALCLGMVGMVGSLDYFTGSETFFFVFYLLAVFVAVWFAGVPLGVLISALSALVWVFGNICAGAHYSSSFIPIWNAAIMFVFYLIVVGLLARIRILHRGLEGRVRQRTAELTREIQERTFLQKKLLETSEREQRRIGYDLHDGLGQHLTGITLASHVLGQKLADKSVPESAEAWRVAELAEEAIELTRSLARNLPPVEIQAGRLVDAFQELAAKISQQLKVNCNFECSLAAPPADENLATQLYRIAQEAITNAVRHGKAKNINIVLDAAGDETALTISDDGIGLPENSRASNGMGLRIMKYRADTIGATFHIARLSSLKGTRVTCTLNAVQPENNDKKN